MLRRMSFGLLAVIWGTAAHAQAPVERDVLERLAPSMQRSTEEASTALKQLLEMKSTKLDAKDVQPLANALERTIQQLKASVKAIYGKDDRRNFDSGDVSDKQRQAANSTLALVLDTDLHKNDAGTFDLPSDGAHLCSPQQIKDLGLNVVSEPFYDEPAPAFCSGFKIGDDLVATAGHCIKDLADCKRTRFIHQFYVQAGNKQPHKNIDAGRIYQCKQIVKRVLETGGKQSDYAIVRTERTMSNVQTATLRSTGTPNEGDRLTVIGYPMGLPAKIAGGAEVRAVRGAYLVASLDTYGGNSGSAVFNTDALDAGTLQVEGILVRGEEDFERQIPCRISKRCDQHGCRGEDVTLASEVRAALGQ